MAVQNQNDIGWYNLLKGRVSKYWKQAQEIHYRTMKKDKKFSGNTWGIQLILELWGYSESIWLHRNDCKYGEGSEVLERQRERNKPIVDKLYEEYDTKLSESDKALFHLPKSERMRRHPKQTKKWIMIVRVCMKQYKKEQKRKANKPQRKLTKYFQVSSRIIGKGVGKEITSTNNSDGMESTPDIEHKDTG